MQRDGHFSLRANLALLGLSWFVKRRAQHQTMERSRRRLLAIEILIPHPPQGTETVTINAGVISAD